MGLAFKELPTEEITKNKDTIVSQLIFKKYVDRMFDRPIERSDPKKYNKEETIRLLSFLAHKLVKNNQSVFYFENLNSSWLETKEEKRTNTYLWLIFSGFVGSILLIVIILGLGLIGKWFFGLVSGLLIGLLVMFGIFIFVITKDATDFYPVDTLNIKKISWRYVLQSGQYLGLFCGVLAGLIGIINFGLLSGLLFGLIGFIFGALIFGLTSALTDLLQISSIEVREKPNQGIWNSLKNWLIVIGLHSFIGIAVFGITGEVIVRLFGGLQVGMTYALIGGVVFGTLYGLIIGLNYGGDFFLNNFILRVILLRSGNLPQKYSHFLDYASERILVRRKGSGYIFIHRMLMDYFAGLEEGSVE
jgi:hypothetical protein